MSIYDHAGPIEQNNNTEGIKMNDLQVINGQAKTSHNGHIQKVNDLSSETMTALVLHGDLSKLKPEQKVEYYRSFCARVGLDPATQPFKLLRLNGKEILYCDRGGTAQLNKKHEVSHQITERKKEDDIYAVTARAFTAGGRQTESLGVVSIVGLRGEALANAMMKAETKAKRRSTLDLLGLGMLDESEVESIPNALAVELDTPNDKSKRDDPGIEIPDRPYYHEEPVHGYEMEEPPMLYAGLVEVALGKVKKELKLCTKENDFHKLKALLHVSGPEYLDKTVTTEITKAYYAQFPERKAA